MTQNNDKNIISRLIIQKILSSESMQYMSQTSSEKANAAFLSACPDKDISFSYCLKNGSSSSYYNSIMDFSVTWRIDSNEIQDLEGNVWNKCTLNIAPTVVSSYGGTIDQFFQRAECIAQVGSLIKEIKEMVPDPIKIMSLTAAQRTERDKKRKFDNDCSKIIESIGAIRKNVRIGGVRRFSRDLIPGIDDGKFEFEIREGSKRNPRIKKYSVVLYEKSNTAYLKRIY